MKKVEITVYKFDELSDEAKQACIEKHRGYNQYGYAWDGENQDTLKKFLDVFNVTLSRNGNIVMNSVHSELTGIRLMSYLWNNYRNDLFKPKYIYNKSKGVYVTMKSRYSKCQIDNSCVLTGYCMDDDILQPVYEAMNKPYPGTFEDLLNECIHAYEKAVERDHEYQDSDEYIIEEIRNADNDYMADGSIYNY